MFIPLMIAVQGLLNMLIKVKRGNKFGHKWPGLIGYNFGDHPQSSTFFSFSDGVHTATCC